MSQTAKILKHLRGNAHLTTIEALLLYRIPRLAARVFDLRKAGHKITSEVAFDATGQEYTRYRLINK